MCVILAPPGKVFMSPRARRRGDEEEEDEEDVARARAIAALEQECQAAHLREVSTSGKQTKTNQNFFFL